MKDKALAEEDFSLVMSRDVPGAVHRPDELVHEPRRHAHARRVARGGGRGHPRHAQVPPPGRDALPRRRRGLAVRPLAARTASIGCAPSRPRSAPRLKGKAWLLALGQQKLDEEADDSFLVWAKDRFPPKLRVHLAPTNIRDVVHRRLLQKTAGGGAAAARRCSRQHRPDLKLFAYGCESVTPDEFVEVYPMLPGQIDLILQITSALRTRSARAQGDDQAIRGLLQLLGELFRDQKLADMPVGALVTLDQIYEVQHTALDADVQASMARILEPVRRRRRRAHWCGRRRPSRCSSSFRTSVPTDAKLVAQCLYDRVDRGNQVAEVTEALEELRRRNLLGYSEKQGYKIQSSAGEEWERERRDIGVAREAISEIVQDALKCLLAEPGPAEARRAGPSPGRGVLRRPPRRRRQSSSTRATTRRSGSTSASWPARSGPRAPGCRRSAETAAARPARLGVRRQRPGRSARARAPPLARHGQEVRAAPRVARAPRASSCSSRRRTASRTSRRRVRDAVAAAWMAGTMYFRGRVDLAAGPRRVVRRGACTPRPPGVLPDLFPHFIATQVAPAELLQLVEAELSGPSPKFLDGRARHPRARRRTLRRRRAAASSRSRIQEYIEAEGGLSGTALLAHFGGPPYGYTANVVQGLRRRACCAPARCASSPRAAARSPPSATPACATCSRRTATSGARPSSRPGEDDIGVPGPGAHLRVLRGRARARRWSARTTRSPTPSRSTSRSSRSGSATVRGQARPAARLARRAGRSFAKLDDALEQCVRSVPADEADGDAGQEAPRRAADGVQLLKLYDAELTDEAIRAVRTPRDVRDYQAAQLATLGASTRPTSRRRRRAIAAQLELGAAVARDRGARRRISRRSAPPTSPSGSGCSQRQEQQAEEARGRVKARDGFSTLTADQAHQVLRPLAAGGHRHDRRGRRAAARRSSRIRSRSRCSGPRTRRTSGSTRS